MIESGVTPELHAHRCSKSLCGHAVSGLVFQSVRGFPTGPMPILRVSCVTPSMGAVAQSGILGLTI